MRGAGQIPVYRGTTDAAKSLREAVEALERGEAIIIYPEGTTTKDPANWPMQAKTGIARLVLLSPDTPVVPVGQWGAAQDGRLQPEAARAGGRTSLASVGEPLDLTRFRGKEPSQATLREITDEIMRRRARRGGRSCAARPPPHEFFVPTQKYVDRSR